MSDVRRHLILQVSRLAFYFHMQALYLATYFCGSKDPRGTRIVKGLRKLRNLQYVYIKTSASIIMSMTHRITSWICLSAGRFLTFHQM